MGTRTPAIALLGYSHRTTVGRNRTYFTLPFTIQMDDSRDLIMRNVNHVAISISFIDGLNIKAHGRGQS